MNQAADIHYYVQTVKPGSVQITPLINEGEWSIMMLQVQLRQRNCALLMFISTVLL